jgi:hypothetical protein
VWQDLLNDKRVLRAIHHELVRGGCPEHIADDEVRKVVEEVYVYLLEEEKAGKPPVETVERMLAIVRPRAYQRGIDALRTRYATDEVVAGSLEDHREQAAPSTLDDELEAREAVATMRANQSQRESAIIQGIGEGKTYKEIAAEQNLSHGHVRTVAASIAPRQGPRLKSMGFALVGVALVGLFVYLASPWRDENRVGNPPPPDAAPEPPKRPPTPEEQKQIAELRARGHAKFLEKDYKACFDAYLAAERLDVETPREAKAEADACYGALQK